MKISGVDGLVFGVDSIDAAGRFFTDFGLQPLTRSASGASFETLNGTSIDVFHTGDEHLPPSVVEGSTVREIIWGVSDEATLDQVADELAKDRPVSRENNGLVRSVDDDGYRVAFRVEKRRPIVPRASRLNIYEAKPGRPVNSRIDFSETIKPVAIAHVVLFSPDVDSALRFYVDRLGFRISDRFKGGHGAFLRSANSPYHHNMFIFRRETKGLHHIAFAVNDFNDVVLGGEAVLKKGWAPVVGPGRHVIGSNYFWYFDSPCGGAMELTADMDRADDNWKSGEWDFVPQNTMAWVMDRKALPGDGPIVPSGICESD